MSEKSLFETVLASTVHDMKNSLGLLMGELDKIGHELDKDSENLNAVSSIRYESSRINYSLMQLLSLYKLENNQLVVQLVEVEVIDFIEDCIAAHAPLAASNKVQIDVNCDDSLIWFFDPDLVGIAINNIIGNSIRYTRSRILLSICIVDGYLLIKVDDDGPGYPQNMIQDPENFIKKVSYNTGSTGLGLFFSATVASSHKRNGKKGHILLKNEGELKGGEFQISLP